ncbi:nitrogen fixation protein [Fibrivirga algicola]|uniref:Nitrogen fixation protein n=1 Tax=Fibrivirga algicola TaxID=2950420 RepID=A0ABX0QDW6_9BACT|nr:nitrogen fixation protein [Fibrivirga algicola]NID10585.1 nitrogen fixation protein [Fibrivirga algicola]
MSARPQNGPLTTGSRPLCPSAPLRAGSQLLGFVKQGGGISLLAEPLPVTPGFVEAATATGPAEERFRFVNTCVEKGCAKWKAGGCSVVSGALERLQAIQEAILPSCGIRPSCRWFMQEGPSACHICPQVTYLNYEAV